MKKTILILALVLPAVHLFAEGEAAGPVTQLAKVEIEQAQPVSATVVESASVMKAQVPAEDPKARMLQAIDNFLTVRKAEEGKTIDEATKKANADAFKVLDGFLNWDAMTTFILKPHLEKLTREEAKKVSELFSEAVRLVAYPAAGTFFSDSKWKILRVEGNDVTTFAYFEEEDLEVESTFHMKKHDGVLKIWDLSVDGDSMALDYRNSFGRIIEKNGGAELVKRLEKALEEKKAAVKDMLP